MNESMTAGRWLLALILAVAGVGVTTSGSAMPSGVEAIRPGPATTSAPTTTAPTTIDTTSVASATAPIVSELTEGDDATAPTGNWSRPAHLDWYPDPVYQTPVRRLTSADGTRFDRNTYSRRQAENTNGELVMTYHGDAEYRVVSRVSGELISVLPIHPDGDPQWHPTDPDRVRYMAGGDASTGELRWYEHDLSTGESSVLADLTDRLQSRLPDAVYLSDEAEGSPSVDGNRMAWTVYDEEERPIAIVAYDLKDDEVFGVLTDLRLDAGRPDWVSMSASGRYVVAGHSEGTFVYEAAGMEGERRLNNKAEHSDLGFDAAGRDVYVAIDFSTGPDAGWLTSIDLATGDVTRILRVYGGANTSVHVSAKGYDRPGWVVVSTYNCKDLGAWTCDKVMAVEIATGRTVHLAHTYNCGESYWTEPHAVVNRSFTRVYFNSDAGSCGIDAEVYELALPNLG